MQEREYIFERIVDFHIAGIKLAQKDAKKGDPEAQQFLELFGDLAQNERKSQGIITKTGAEHTLATHQS